MEILAVNSLIYLSNILGDYYMSDIVLHMPKMNTKHKINNNKNMWFLPDLELS